MIDRGELLRGEYRLSLRQDEHTDTETHPFGDRGEERQGGQSFEPRFVGRVGRIVGQREVIADPE